MSRHRERAGKVLLEFQSVMEEFLAIERDVLTTYLASARPSHVHALPPLPSVHSPADGPAALAPERTGQPAISDAAAVERPDAETARHSATVSPGDVHRVSIHEVDRGGIHNDAPAPDVRADALAGSPFVRLTPRAVGRPLQGNRAGLAPERTIVITDDGRGVAEALAHRLRREGYSVAVVRTSSDHPSSVHNFVCGLESLAEAEHLVELISSSSRGISALIHLAPLGPVPDFDQLTPAQAWERLLFETRSLFLMAKASRVSLQTAAAEGGAAVIAVTAMGGAFASDAAHIERPFLPWQGGVVGFAKCLALEWPQVRVRAVDLDPGESAEVLAVQIFEELWASDEASEVGYSHGNRLGLEMEVVSAAVDHESGFAIPSDAVILATGGARGITADTCLELASRYQPTFVLVGQSPLPDPIEPAEIAALSAPADLKRVLLGLLGKDGTRVSVPMVEKAYQRILRDREIRRNIGALTAAGARVHYVSLDIRDDDAFAALIEQIYAMYGRLDGVIHGAGIIEDKLVQDKSVESFERVLQTKTRSAFSLSRCLRPESLRFVVFFSSVAGRFGNRGQGDYAAANEVVNKLAVLLNLRWPTRVCSINWAPWDKRGMVSPELKREFIERGVGLLDPSAGRRALWEEIQQPRTDRPEIVVAASTNAALTPAAPVPVPVKTPLMKGATLQKGAPGTAQYERLLDQSVDRYLRDHRLDGRPVLPLAFAAELMAEAAQATWPDLNVLAVRNLQLLKGVVLGDAPLPLTIVVRAPVSIVDPMSIIADVEITTPSDSPVHRYRAVVELGARLVAAPAFTPPISALQPFSLALPEAYRLWTFHGPAFQRITSIKGLAADAIVGEVFSRSQQSGLSALMCADWSIDPFVFDCALQMLLMWSRAWNEKTALPSRFRAFRRFGALSDTPLRCYVRVESLAGGHALRSDVHFVGPGGEILGILEGMEASCTAALNRLAVQ